MKERLKQVFEEYIDGVVWAAGGLLLLFFALIAGRLSDDVLERAKEVGHTPTDFFGTAALFSANVIHSSNEEIYGAGITAIAFGIILAVVGRMARKIWKAYEPGIKDQLKTLKETLLEAIRTSKLPLVIQGAEESEARGLLIDMIAKGYGEHCKMDDSLPRDLLDRFSRFFDGKQPFTADHARVITITPVAGGNGDKHWNEVTTYNVRCTSLELPVDRRPDLTEIHKYRVRYRSQVAVPPNRPWQPTDHTLQIKVDGADLFDFATAVTVDAQGNASSNNPECDVKLTNGQLIVIFETDLKIEKALTRVEVTEKSVISAKDNVIALHYPLPCFRATTIINLPPAWRFVETHFNPYGAPRDEQPTWRVQNHPTHVLIAQTSRWVPPGLYCTITYES